MSAKETQVLLRNLVHWVADTAPDNWQKVAINMEVLADQHEASSSWIIQCFAGPDHVKIDYRVSGAKKLDMRDVFLELNDLSALTGDRWTVCDFAVTADGKYTVNYSYSPPPRLSGNR